MRKAKRILDEIGISARFIGEDKAYLAEQLIKDYAVCVAIETLQSVIAKIDRDSKDHEAISNRLRLIILSAEIITP